jgi:hypothetical protein
MKMRSRVDTSRIKQWHFVAADPKKAKGLRVCLHIADQPIFAQAELRATIAVLRMQGRETALYEAALEEVVHLEGLK